MLDIESFAIELDGVAHWRRQCAEAYPNDARNVTAAELSEKLAAEVREVRGSLLHARLSRAVQHKDSAEMEADRG